MLLCPSFKANQSSQFRRPPSGYVVSACYRSTDNADRCHGKYYLHSVRGRRNTTATIFFSAAVLEPGAYTMMRLAPDASTEAYILPGSAMRMNQLLYRQEHLRETVTQIQPPLAIGRIAERGRHVIIALPSTLHQREGTRTRHARFFPS